MKRKLVLPGIEKGNADTQPIAYNQSEKLWSNLENAAISPGIYHLFIKVVS
jgi:hypothetical protein